MHPFINTSCDYRKMKLICYKNCSISSDESDHRLRASTSKITSLILNRIAVLFHWKILSITVEEILLSSYGSIGQRVNTLLAKNMKVLSIFRDKTSIKSKRGPYEALQKNLKEKFSRS